MSFWCCWSENFHHKGLSAIRGCTGSISHLIFLAKLTFLLLFLANFAFSPSTFTIFPTSLPIVTHRIYILFQESGEKDWKETHGNIKNWWNSSWVTQICNVIHGYDQIETLFETPLTQQGQTWYYMSSGVTFDCFSIWNSTKWLLIRHYCFLYIFWTSSK